MRCYTAELVHVFETMFKQETMLSKLTLELYPIMLFHILFEI